MQTAQSIACLQHLLSAGISSPLKVLFLKWYSLNLNRSERTHRTRRTVHSLELVLFLLLTSLADDKDQNSRTSGTPFPPNLENLPPGTTNSPSHTIKRVKRNHGATTNTTAYFRRRTTWVCHSQSPARC